MHLRLVPARLHALLEPRANAAILDVHVFDADGPAVSLLQSRNELTQGGARQTNEMAGVKGLVQVGFAEAEFGQFQERVTRFGLAEWVKSGDEMAQLPVAIDEPDDGCLACGIGARGRLPLAQVKPFRRKVASFRRLRRGRCHAQCRYCASMTSTFQRDAKVG